MSDWKSIVFSIIGGMVVLLLFYQLLPTMANSSAALGGNVTGANLTIARLLITFLVIGVCIAVIGLFIKK